MVDGGLATALLIIGAFTAFVLWAKTAPGRDALRRAFGEPDTGAKPTSRRRTGKGARASAGRKTAAPKPPIRRRKPPARR